MVEREALKDHKIQDYLDDRLNERDRAAVAAYLLAHPDVASEVETLRRQNEALKGIGQEILDEPVPERLRAVLRRQTRDELQRQTVASLGARRRWRFSGFLEAAAAVLLLCVGGGIGWFMNDQLTPRMALEDLIAANAADVYAFYGAEGNYPTDFPPDRTADLVSWISRSFDREIGPPDLAELSYQYRGGRIMPISGANSGLFQFEGPDGARLAVFFWPADQPPTRLTGMGRQKNVAARYWLGDGFSFAVMSDKDNPDLESAAKAVFSYYGTSLGAQ